MDFDDMYSSGDEFFPLGEIGGGELKPGKAAKTGKYIKNVGKTVGTGMKGILNMYLPESISIANEMKTAFEETKGGITDALRKTSSEVKSAIGFNGNTEGVGLKETMNKASKEILTDFKKAAMTGNFTGKSNDLGGDMFGDMGMEDEWSGGSTTTPVMAGALLEGQSLVGQATMNQQTLHHAQRETSANVRHAQNIGLQKNMASNIEKITSFLGDVVGKNIAAGMEYRSKDLALSKELVKTMRDLKAISEAGLPQAGTKRTSKLADVFGYGLDGSAYGKNVLGKMGEFVNNSPIGMLTAMLPMMAMGREMGGSSNTMGNQMIQNVAKGLPGMFLNDKSKNKLSSLNETMGAMPAAINSKMNEMALYSDNPMMRFFGSMMGVNEISTKKSNMGLKNPNAKAIFDQKTHRTINEVIPALLSKQLAVSSGEEETYYDYKAGSFKKSSHAIKQFKYEKDQAYNSSTRLNATKTNIMGSIEKISQDTGQKPGDIRKDFDQIIRNIIDSKVTFNPNRAVNDTRYRKVITKQLKNPNNVFKFLEQFAAMTKDDQTQFNLGISAATANVSKFYVDIGNTASERGGGTFIADAVTDELQQEREIMIDMASNVNRYEKGSQARLNAEMKRAKMKESSLMEFDGRVGRVADGGITDNKSTAMGATAGSSATSILSNIYETILGGIVVFPTQGGAPDHLLKRVKKYNTSKTANKAFKIKYEEESEAEFASMAEQQYRMNMEQKAQSIANQSLFQKVLKVDSSKSSRVDDSIDSFYNMANSGLNSMLFGNNVKNAGDGPSKAELDLAALTAKKRDKLSILGGTMGNKGPIAGERDSVDDLVKARTGAYNAGPTLNTPKGRLAAAGRKFNSGMYGTRTGDVDLAGLYNDNAFDSLNTYKAPTEEEYNEISFGQGSKMMKVGTQKIPTTTATLDVDFTKLKPIIEGSMGTIADRLSSIDFAGINTMELHDDLTTIISILRDDGVTLGKYSPDMESRIREINLSSLSFAFPHIDLNGMNTMPEFKKSPYRGKLKMWKNKVFGAKSSMKGAYADAKDEIENGRGGFDLSKIPGASKIPGIGLISGMFGGLTKGAGALGKGLFGKKDKVSKEPKVKNHLSLLDLLNLGYSKEEAEAIMKDDKEKKAKSGGLSSLMGKGSGLLGMLGKSGGQLASGAAGGIGGALAGLMKGGGAGLGGLLAGGGGLLGSMFKGGGNIGGGILTGVTGKLGSIFGGKKKSSIGDSDGDGSRDGSYAEMKKDKKEAGRDKVMMELLKNVIAIRKSISGGALTGGGGNIISDDEDGLLDKLDDISDVVGLGATVFGGGAVAGLKKKIGGIFGKKGAAAVAKTAGKGGGGLAGRIAGGMKPKGLAGKALGGIGKAAGNVGSKLLGFLKTLFTKKPFNKFISPKNSGKLMKAISSKLSGKAFAKAGTKIAGKLASLAGPIGIGLMAAEFTTGMARANRYFGVGKSGNVTIGMKISAGVANLVSGLTLGILPADFLVNFFFKILGSEENKEFLASSQEFLNERARILGVGSKALSDYETAPWTQRIFGGKKKFAKLLGFKDVDNYVNWRDNKYKPLMDIYNNLRDSMGGKSLEQKPKDEETAAKQKQFRKQYLDEASIFIKTNNLMKVAPGMTPEDTASGEIDTPDEPSEDDVNAAGAMVAAGVVGAAAYPTEDGDMKSSAAAGSSAMSNMESNNTAGIAAVAAGAATAAALRPENKVNPSGSLAENPQNTSDRKLATNINTELDALKALYKEQYRHNGTSESMMRDLLNLMTRYVMSTGGGKDFSSLFGSSKPTAGSYNPDNLSSDPSELIASGN